MCIESCVQHERHEGIQCECCLHIETRSDICALTSYFRTDHLTQTPSVIKVNYTKQGEIKFNKSNIGLTKTTRMYHTHTRNSIVRAVSILYSTNLFLSISMPRQQHLPWSSAALTSLALMAMSDACPLAMLRGWWSMMLALGSAERCPGSPDARSIAPSPNAYAYRVAKSDREERKIDVRCQTTDDIGLAHLSGTMCLLHSASEGAQGKDQANSVIQGKYEKNEKRLRYTPLSRNSTEVFISSSQHCRPSFSSGRGCRLEESTHLSSDR